MASSAAGSPAPIKKPRKPSTVWGGPLEHPAIGVALIEAELAAYADGQGITKDAATAWLRSTEAFKNRKSSDYKIKKTYQKITRQLSPLTLVMEIAALQHQNSSRSRPWTQSTAPAFFSSQIGCKRSVSSFQCLSFQPLLGAAPPVWPTEPTQGSDSDDMEAALPGEETAAASALVPMNTSPAAPRPDGPVSEAEVSVLAQVPGDATAMRALQQMSSDISSVKTAMVVTKWRAKSSFGSVLIFQQNLVEARGSIQTGEILSSMQLVKQVINVRQGVAILNCQLIERPAVYHHAQGPVLLLYKQDWAPPWRRRRLNQLPSCSSGDSLYMRLNSGIASGTGGITCSTPLSGGKPDGSAKTSAYACLIVSMLAANSGTGNAESGGPISSPPSSLFTIEAIGLESTPSFSSTNKD
ncbi:TPA: hypothetical protein ACH3X3_012761 [Trebouxia sp. C0006]